MVVAYSYFFVPVCEVNMFIMGHGLHSAARQDVWKFVYRYISKKSAPVLALVDLSGI